MQSDRRYHQDKSTHIGIYKKRDLFQNVKSFPLPRAANENVISREAVSCHRRTSETIHENSEQIRLKLENTKVSINNVIALNVF